MVARSENWELDFGKVYLAINLGNIVIFHRDIEKRGVALDDVQVRTPLCNMKPQTRVNVN